MDKYFYSNTSLEKLAQAHPDIQIVCNELINVMDVSVLCTYRSEQEQNDCYSRGASKLRFPYSRHNRKPSLAIDLQPYPRPLEDKELRLECCLMAGYFLGIAYLLRSQGIIKSHFRWGGDWNQNNKISDESFSDMFHFEIIT